MEILTEEEVTILFISLAKLNNLTQWKIREQDHKALLEKFTKLVKRKTDYLIKPINTK